MLDRGDNCTVHLVWSRHYRVRRAGQGASAYQLSQEAPVDRTSVVALATRTPIDMALTPIQVLEEVDLDQLIQRVNNADIP